MHESHGHVQRWRAEGPLVVAEGRAAAPHDWRCPSGRTRRSAPVANRSQVEAGDGGCDPSRGPARPGPRRGARAHRGRSWPSHCQRVMISAGRPFPPEQMPKASPSGGVSEPGVMLSASRFTGVAAAAPMRQHDEGVTSLTSWRPERRAPRLGGGFLPGPPGNGIIAQQQSGCRGSPIPRRPRTGHLSDWAPRTARGFDSVLAPVDLSAFVVLLRKSRISAGTRRRGPDTCRTTHASSHHGKTTAAPGRSRARARTPRPAQAGGTGAAAAAEEEEGTHRCAGPRPRAKR